MLSARSGRSLQWELSVDFDIDELRRLLPSAKQIASDLYGVKWRHNRARCPRGENHAHGDRDPSFAYLPKVDRLQCFSQQCFGPKPVDAFDFVEQMEKCGFQDAARRLADRYGGATTHGSKSHNAHHRDKKGSLRERLESEGWRQVAEYPMGDGVRKVRFEHPGRLQPDKNRPEKTFIWEHGGDEGTWKSGRGRRSHFAYVNSAFRERDQIESALGVESERSADTAGKLGFPAFSFKEITKENATAFAGSICGCYGTKMKKDAGSFLERSKCCGRTRGASRSSSHQMTGRMPVTYTTPSPT